ncbi:MAG: hypothetical protein IT373_13745 [Polyangiaceae bacterium]|nr:hypothetical protein [Polyangiaceae bacterium]
MLELRPGEPAAEPRDAATVIVVRSAARTGAAAAAPGADLEVFCVRRHTASAFLGGAVVFPGGKLDAADLAPGWAAGRARPVGARAMELSTPRAGGGADAALGLGLAVCACRETLEEAGILASVPALDAHAVEALRGAAAGRFAEALEEAGALVLDTAALVPFARWVTPTVERRRYDTRFYLLPLPPGQVGAHDTHETTQSLWASPAAVIAGHLAGELWLAPPTLRTLELLATVADLAGATALAKRQSLRPVCPEFVPADTPLLVLPGDPLHTEREPLVAGPSRFALRDARFVSEEA